MDIDPTGGAPTLASIDVPVEEVDLATDLKSQEILTVFCSNVEGLFKPKDFS